MKTKCPECGKEKTLTLDTLPVTKLPVWSGYCVECGLFIWEPTKELAKRILRNMHNKCKADSGILNLQKL